jgi:hypothetical protein
MMKPVLVILSLCILLGCGGKSDSSSSSGGPVVRIVVTPDPGSIPNSNSNQFQQFTAVGYDPNNQPVPGIKFKWTDNGSFSCIDQNGLARATGIPPSGETIFANYGSLSQAASLNISSNALISPPTC